MSKDIWNDYRIRQKGDPTRFTSRVPEDLTDSEIDEWGSRLGLGILEENSDWLWVREWDGAEVVERPVYLNTLLEERIEGYFRLVAERPDLFTPSDRCPIRTDRYAMLSFTKVGRSVGLVFDNRPYYLVVSDLHDAGGELRPYGRVLYPDRQGNGTVIIPRLLRSGEPSLFGIIHIFRHSIRTMTGGEFPRGFQVPGITPAENAGKELWEEFRIPVGSLSALTLLGHTRPDSGLSSGQVQIYLADISGVQPKANLGHEGIVESEWLTKDELLRRIHDGIILDGMTQTAILLLQLHQQESDR